MTIQPGDLVSWVQQEHSGSIGWNPGDNWWITYDPKRVHGRVDSVVRESPLWGTILKVKIGDRNYEVPSSLLKIEEERDVDV